MGKIMNWILAITVLLLLLHCYGLHNRNAGVRTVIKRDTVVKREVVCRDSIRTKAVYLRLPCVVRDTVNDTLVVADSVTVEAVEEQKVYEDSDYTAWVSGVMPRLDSIRLCRKVEIAERAYTPPKKRQTWLAAALAALGGMIGGMMIR